MWAFFYTVRRSMLSIEHLPQAYCCSTAQHSTQSYLHKAAKQVRAGQSATTQASKQASRVGESQHVVEHLQLAMFSKRSKESKPVRPTKTYQYNHSQAATNRRDARRMCLHFIFRISASIVRHSATYRNLSLRPLSSS